MAGEADKGPGKKGANPLRGLIRKPQVLGSKEPRDSVEALLSRVNIDAALPGRLSGGAREVRAGVESANDLFKLDILRDLAAEASADETRKRFAAVALHTARKQLDDYKKLLEDHSRKHSELNTTFLQAWEKLQEEQAPMLQFLEKHAPDDPGVVRANEDLKKFTAEMQGAKKELDGLGALLTGSREKESGLQKALEEAAKGLR